MPTRLAIYFESDPLVHERAALERSAEHERHRALDDEERVVLLLVHVRLQLTPDGDLDDPEVEARRVDRAGEELHVPEMVSLARRNHYWSAHAAPFKRG